MYKMSEKFTNNESAKASITISIGKPNKEGRRFTSVEFKVKQLESETDVDFENRYNYIKTKALREL